MEDLETIIMELLVNAGSARSAALTALQLARKGDFVAAEQAMAESHEFVKHAHKIQTQLIGMDEGSGKLNSIVVCPSRNNLTDLTGVAVGARPSYRKPYIAANTQPNTQETPTPMSPGRIKLWLITKRPIWVVPERSNWIAARSLG